MKRNKTLQDMVNWVNTDCKANEWDEYSRQPEMVMLEQMLMRYKCYRGFNLYNAYAPINQQTGEAEKSFIRLASEKTEPKVEGYDFIKLNSKPFIQYY